MNGVCRSFIFVFLSFLLSGAVFAKDVSNRSIISLDTGWLLEGLVNEGMGFGIDFEQELWNFLTFKIRHSVIQTHKNAVGMIANNQVFSIAPVFYPFTLVDASFARNFDNLGLGTGIGYSYETSTDPVNYSAKYEYIIPFWNVILCYRFIIAGRFVIEPYVEYIKPLVDWHSSTTGIAMSTTWVDIEGINFGVIF